MHHADPLLRHRVALDDRLGDVAGDGDHPLAAGHHRVVAALQLALGTLVQAVHGRHQRHAGTPGGDGSAPGRCPRMGMDDRRAQLGDQLAEPDHVGRHGQRALAGHRQLDMLDAAADQPPLQPAAGRADDRPPAFAVEADGEIDRAALHTAAVQPWHDVQDHGPIAAVRGRTGYDDGRLQASRAARASIGRLSCKTEFECNHRSSGSSRGDGRRLAFRHRRGASPAMMFLPGFRSDMDGAKATALQAHGVTTGRGFLRSTIAAMAAPSGRFEDGCIGDWLDDALAVLDHSGRAGRSCSSAPAWAAG